MSKPLNRRAVLASAPAVLATTVVAASASANALVVDAVSTDLLELIEAHRNAEKAFGDALDAEEVAEEAYKASRPQKRLVMTTPGNHWEVNPRPADRWWDIRDRARDEIAATFDRLRRSIPRELSEEIRAASWRDINRQQVAAYRRLVKAINSIYEEHERSGYLAAYTGAHAAMEAEIDALMDVCAYRCRNMADIAEKAKYVCEYSGGLDGYPEHLTAFVESMFSAN